MGITITGLASGMDTETMVEELMQAQREYKVDPLEKKIQLYEWEQEAYQNVNSTMANFIIDTKDNLGLVKTGTSGTSYNQTADDFTWVKTAESSTTSVATATATTTTPNGTYDITINQLADNVSAMSGSTITTGTSGTLEDQFGLAADVSFTLETKEGSKTFTFSYNTDTIDEVVDEINDANIGLTAYYDESLDRFFLSTDSTGSENYFKITADGDNFLTNTLGLQIDSDHDGTIDGAVAVDTQYSGQDLSYDFEGLTGLTSSSNTVTVNDITMTVTDVGSTQITVDTDIDAVYEKIEEFVTAYNSMIDEINSVVDENKDYDYEPLTDAEKEDMTEDEIELWEEKAKSGIIADDSTLSGMASDMRIAMYESVTGVGVTLSGIGIETSSYSEKGKLHIDETDLREAIEDDPQAIMDLFFQEPSDAVNEDDDELTTAEQKQKYEESGIVYRVYNIMTEGMKDIIDVAGPGDDEDLLRDVKSDMLVDYVTGVNVSTAGVSALEAQIESLEDDVEWQEELLETIEARYWTKFTAMESAISEMNSTSSWLASYFA